MSKYLTVFKVSLAERMVYRFNFFTGTFVRFLPLISTVFLWKAVYAARNGREIQDYTFEAMIGYFVLIHVARSFSSMPGLARTVAQEIRDGELNKYIIRPINYPFYMLMLRLAHKAVYFAMAAIPFAAVIAWLSRIGYFPPWPGWAVFMPFLASLMMAFAIGFLLNLLFGLVGFWFLEIQTFLFLYMVVGYFVSGQMIPFDLLPGAAARILLWLPFHYEAYFPVTVYLGRYPPDVLAMEMFVESCWIVGLLLLVVFVYRRGLKRYSGYGG